MEAQRNKGSIAAARGVPVFLTLIIFYAAYVITGPLAIQYILNPPEGLPRRIALGLAIPIAFYFLLIPVAATWIRLLVVVLRSPGYVPYGEPPESTDGAPAPGLEEFWRRDVFVCDQRGYPIWCAYCNNWKPDRTHHNQDVGRCTLKMDHFCPWVGGVVGEKSYKFFVQFNFYSFLLSAYTMSVLAFLLLRKERAGLEIQWLIALGLAGFFTLFTLGMVGNCLWMVFRNVTTIENLDANTWTMLLAVLLPPELQGQDLNGPPAPPPQAHVRPDVSPTRSGDSARPLNSDIDDPSHSTYFSNLHAPRPLAGLPFCRTRNAYGGTISYPLYLPTDRPPLPAPNPRTFAILETLPGMNVWDLGSSYLNFKAIFGENLHDWLLPIKHSPCCDHSSSISWYPLGPDFEELLVEAGLAPRPSSLPLPEKGRQFDSKSQSRKRRRKRRLDAGWQNGERPDGWDSAKEARRMRNEARRSMHGAPPGDDVLR